MNSLFKQILGYDGGGVLKGYKYCVKFWLIRTAEAGTGSVGNNARS